MSGTLRQSLPHIVNRITKALTTSKGRTHDVSTVDSTNSEAIRDKLITIEYELLNDKNQIVSALDALKRLDADWQNVIAAISDANARQQESELYHNKRFGADGYENLHHACEEQLIIIETNRSLLHAKSKSYFPQTPLPAVTGPTVPQVQLPNLAFPIFDGDIRNFRYFEEQFAVIDSHPQFTKAQKLQYLKNFTSGSAHSLIGPLPLTDANYDAAKILLQEAYGRQADCIKALYNDFRQTPRAVGKPQACKETYEALERTLQQLSANGERIDTQHLELEWRDKFPVFLLKDTMKALPANPNFTALRKELRRQIDLNEEFARPMPSSPAFKVTVNAVASDTQSSSSVGCVFCDQAHSSHQCKKPGAEKYIILAKKRLCRSCFAPRKGYHRCQAKRHDKCSQYHHLSLPCPKPRPADQATPAKSAKSAAKEHKINAASAADAETVTTAAVMAIPQHPVPEQSLQIPCDVSPLTDQSPPVADDTDISAVIFAENDDSLRAQVQNLKQKLVAATTIGGKRYKRIVLLPTKEVELADEKHTKVSTVLFFDTGADQSFIHNGLAKKNNFKPVGQRSVWLRTFGDSKPKLTACDEYLLRVISAEGELIDVFALGVDNLVDQIPALIDPRRVVVGSVLPQLLIASDHYYEFYPYSTTSEGIRFSTTKVGDVYAGPIYIEDVPQQADQCRAAAVVNICSVDTQIEPDVKLTPTENQTLSKVINYWYSLESIQLPEDPNETSADIARRHFKENVRFRNNRFHVAWPFKCDNPELPLNFNICFKSLVRLYERLKKDNLLEKYNAVFETWLQREEIEDAPGGIRPPDSLLVSYMLHRAVLKLLSLTTPVRPVFNCSFKGSKNSKSLNDMLYSGENLVPLLIGMLIRFRIFWIVCIGDIEKAFHAMRLHLKNRDCVRFLWIKDLTRPPSKDNLRILRHCCPLFGSTVSPFLLMMCIHMLLSWFRHKPIAVELEKNMYADNGIWGGKFAADVIQKAQDAKEIFQHASMNLREFLSNDQQVNAALNVLPEIKKVLGLMWNPLTDTLSIEVDFAKLNANQDVTKRIVLSFTASIYDPLGFISPVVIQFKVFIQTLCKKGFDWDELLSEEDKLRWKSLLDSNTQQQITIPRKAVIFDAAVTQLHVFGDASKTGYGAVAYIRQIDPQEHIHVHMLMSKTRVAPIKKTEPRAKPPKSTSIPKLELLATVLGADLIELIQKEANIEFDAVTLWTDSSCVLEWLHRTPMSNDFQSKCMTRVQNSVNDIRHVRTKDNPADICSRGCSISELSDNKLWWYGPHWLSLDESLWPDPAVIPTKVRQPHNPNVAADNDKEAANPDFTDPSTPQTDESIDVNVSVATRIDSETTLTSIMDVEKYSHWTTLIMAVTYILMFIKKCKPAKTPLIFSYPGEIRDLAWRMVLLTAQAMNPPTAAAIQQLNIRKDEHGLLRCYHRLQTAQPEGLVYLPHGHIAELLIIYHHKRLFHNGPKCILNALRCQYWITNGRRYIEQIQRKGCFKCKRMMNMPFKLPPMPPLPSDRVNFYRPFQHVGIDCAGPFYIKSDTGDQVSKSRETRKAWMVLFTCFAVRAIHVELVEKMDANSFLNAFRRFVSRRAIPKSILTDCGTNFSAARPVITKHWLQEHRSITDYFHAENISWKLTTEHAPWTGGIYERLIGIVKSCMKKSIGRKILTRDTLETVLIEIEAAINHRPITPVENKLENFSSIALRPVDFLLPDASNLAPSFDDYDPNDPDFQLMDSTQTRLLQLWKSSAAIRSKFHQIWKTEYLNLLREVSATAHQQKGVDRQPEAGEVVLVGDDDVGREHWRLGIITEVKHSEVDNCIRAVSVKTPNGHVINRPINKLYPLELKATEVPVKLKPSKPTDVQTSDRVLRPRKAQTFFILLALTALITGVSGNQCPPSFDGHRHEADLLMGEYCKPRGHLVFQTNDIICWTKVSCNGTYLRSILNSELGYCGPKCTCPHWASDCTHYKGPSSNNSTWNNLAVRQLIDDAKPADATKANVIELYDGTRKAVSILHLIHQEINLNESLCSGKGVTTGTPAYCSQNECHDNATRFCMFHPHEIVFWVANGQKVAIKAWGETEDTAPPKWQNEPAHIDVTCSDNLLSIRSNKTIDIVEIQASADYHAHRVFGTSTDIHIPNTILALYPALSLTILYSDGSRDILPAYCTATSFCETIRCSTICIDELLNPQCRPWKTVALVATLLAITWFVTTITLACLFCRHRRRSHTKAALSFGGRNSLWRIFKRSSRLPEGPSSIMIKFHTNVAMITAATVICLVTAASAFSEVQTITASTSSCQVKTPSWIDCTFEETTVLWMNSNADVGLMLKDEEQRPFGTVIMSATIQSACFPEEQFYTRIYSAKVSSSKRCRGSGPCSGENCAKTTPKDYIEGLGIANKYPGITDCAESCGCWGCGCGLCSSGCLFWRYYALPTSPAAIRIYSCSKFTPVVLLKVTVDSQQTKETTSIVLQEGQPTIAKDMMFTLLDIHEPATTERLHLMEMDNRVALLDTFGVAASKLLKCPDQESATKLENCILMENSCLCHPADDIAKCTCQDNQILHQVMKDRSLPYRLNQGWLRSYEHGVMINQESRVQIKVDLKKLHLTTVIDRNRCQAQVNAVTGCANCDSGAAINITCSTDFGTAMGHVSCKTFAFSLKCSQEGLSQVVRVQTTEAKINEHCSLQCPAEKSEFNIEGVLWNSPPPNEWSPNTAEDKSPAGLNQLEEAARAAGEFITANYWRIVVTLVAALVIILIIKKAIGI